MGTRLAENDPAGSCEMPGKFSFKNHVKKLTKECLKAFETSPDQKSNEKMTPSDVFEDATKDDNGLTDDGYQGSVIDGADSGVDRALSSNGSNSDRYTPAQSCGSSLVSCYSEPEVDRASECGSENSKEGKVKGKKSADGDRKRLTSRKLNDKSLSESCSENSSTCESQNVTQSARLSDLTRTMSSRFQNGKKSDLVRNPLVRRAESSTRASSSREKSVSRTRNAAQTTVTSHDKLASKTRNLKPLNVAGKVDDGRWPSSVHKIQSRESRAKGLIEQFKPKTSMSSSVALTTSMSSSFGVRSPAGEAKSSALDKYGTLPRRPKRKSIEQSEEPITQAVLLARSSSVSREPSLNRAATLRRQQSKDKDKEVGLSNGKSLPPYPKTRKSTGKTVIYHEISIQTNVTGEDISNMLSGIVPTGSVITSVVEKANKAVQSEGREKLKKMEESYLKQAEELENERTEKERLKLERQSMLLRIGKLLGYGELNGNGENELNELEQHFQAVGLTVIKQQEELSELRHFKSIMQRDLEKSFAAQKNLLQQQQDIEAEYFELQEFLQAEKTALSESLNDTEAELERLRKEVAKKENLLLQQQEECKHLVRICEQRRQENLSLEAKLTGLEQRSRDVIVQQGAAVSGAAVALSGLGARLDNLVEQLATSCNISEKDLEDVIYHNEVYSQGQSEDNSPDSPLPKKSIEDAAESPKRSTSFLNAIIGALRSATQSPFSTLKKNSVSNSQTDHSSDSFGLLDGDNDNCLSNEAVFPEENASSVSHYTDCISCSSRSDLMKFEACDDAITLVPPTGSPDLSRSDSIQNLSAAILARQEIEKIERNLSPDFIIPTEVNSLVDKVIDVDNLLTKLLKVLRLIQMDSDASMERLQDQRMDLTDKLQQEQLYRQKMENHMQTLQYELKEARSQLSARILQLEQVKMMLNNDARLIIADSQRQFAAINNALGTLQSMQDVVNQYPPLAKLQQDLEDCSYRSASGDDLNANTATTNGNLNNSVVKEVKRNGPVLTTAV